MKKWLSAILTVAIVMSYVCVVNAASADKYGSLTNGEGKIDNVLTYEELLNNEEETKVYSDTDKEKGTTIGSSMTNGNGEIKHIIVIDTDVMPFASHRDVELPANTAVFFTGEYVSSAVMSVEYMPSNVDIYYGLGTKSDGTGYHYANRATGGSGSVTITPSSSSYVYLYPYLANGNSKTVYVDFDYTITVALRAQNEVAEENGSCMVDVDPNRPDPCYMTESFSAVFDGNTSVLKHITFTDEYKYFTMTVHNTGKYGISVDVGNKVYTVDGNSSKIIYSTSAWGAQTCTFGFATKVTGQPMYGSVECMLATKLEEVTP